MTGAAGNEGHESPETGHGPAYRPEENGASVTLVAQDEAVFGPCRGATLARAVGLAVERAGGGKSLLMCEWRLNVPRVVYST